MGTSKKGALKQDCCSLTPRFCAAATAFHPRDSCSGLRCLAAGLSAGRWTAVDASPRLRVGQRPAWSSLVGTGCSGIVPHGAGEASVLWESQLTHAGAFHVSVVSHLPMFHRQNWSRASPDLRTGKETPPLREGTAPWGYFCSLSLGRSPPSSFTPSFTPRPRNLNTVGLLLSNGMRPVQGTRVSPPLPCPSVPTQKQVIL